MKLLKETVLVASFQIVQARQALINNGQGRADKYAGWYSDGEILQLFLEMALSGIVIEHPVLKAKWNSIRKKEDELYEQTSSSS